MKDKMSTGLIIIAHIRYQYSSLIFASRWRQESPPQKKENKIIRTPVLLNNATQ